MVVSYGLAPLGGYRVNVDRLLETAYYYDTLSVWMIPTWENFEALS